MAKCRVTVIKTYYDDQIAQNYLKNYQPDQPEKCPYFEEGQSFLLDEDMAMPEGFCPMAWQTAIDKFAFALIHGAGRFYGGAWMKEDNQIVTCCIDGVRPVAFLLERVDGN